MKIVILAAGKGSRLGQGDQPKPLTLLVTGQSILAYQLEMLSLYIPLKDVLIVVGYHKEYIQKAFPTLQYIENPDYATENTSKSLLKALKHCHEDVLWLNGDVVFHPSIIKTLLATPRTSMVVNKGTVGEEEVKYRQNSQGLILEVSKQVTAPQGEALGINFCAAHDLDLFRHQLEKCAPMDYFERGLELSIAKGMSIWSVCVDRELCAEIDFPEDLVRANTMLTRWKNLGVNSGYER